MACKFSCFLSYSDAFKEHDVGIFQSDIGDQYVVKYKSNVCRDLILNIEWTVPKQILVTVKLYNTTFKRCFCSKGVVINGRKTIMKLRGAFNVGNSRNYKILCVINMIPYITFNECQEQEPFDSGFIEPEYQQSLDDKKNVIYEKTDCTEEISNESRTQRKDIAEKVEEIDNQNEFEYSLPLIKKNHQQLERVENDLVQNKCVLKNDRKLKDSNIVNSENITSDKAKTSLLLKNIESLNSCDKSDKKMRNSDVCEIQESEEFFNFRENKETKTETFQNNFTKNSENKSQKKPSILIDGLISSNDSNDNFNAFKKLTSQDERVDNMLTNYFSKEVMGSVNIDIHENLQSSNVTVKNNLTMEVDFPELESENHALRSEKPGLIFSVLQKKNSSDNTDLKIEEFSSNNIAPKLNNTSENMVETDENLLLDNKDIKHSDGTISTVDMEVKIIPESNISLESNESSEKHFSSISNDVSTYSQELDSVKAYNSVQSPYVVTEPSTINMEMTPGIETGISKKVIDSHNKFSQKLVSSKTSLMFRALTNKLSFDNCDTKLTNINEGTARNSEFCGKKIPESQSANVNFFPIMENEYKGLSMDMLDLLKTGDMVDALITNGDKHMKVHRAIVSARSPVLKEIFIKHRQDDVKYRAVVDIPSYIFEDVIIFLYVGLVYIESKKMTQDLHKVAEKYCINDLIDICSKHIKK